MAKNTVFQALDKAISGNWSSPSTSIAEPHINSYDLSPSGGNMYSIEQRIERITYRRN